MRALFRLLVLAALGAGLLLGASYVGANAEVGKLLGPRPPRMGTRSVDLVWRGEVPDAPGARMGWVFTYDDTALPETWQVRIVVSPTGRILATSPRDLEDRIDRYYRDRLP